MVKLWLSSIACFFLITGFLSMTSCRNGTSRQGGAEDGDPGVTGYRELKQRLLKGWNTFDVTSISTQVLLPEGLAVNLQINDTVSGEHLKLMFTGNRAEGAERVWTKAHTPDGSYTDFVVRWRDFGMRLQTHAEGDHLYVLATPSDSTQNPGVLQLNGSIYYGREGEILRRRDRLVADLPGREIEVTLAVKELGPGGEAVLCFSMEQQAAYSTAGASLPAIREKIEVAEKAYLEKKNSYGEQADVYDALQNALNWMVIYDSENDRLVTPVSRPWAYGWGEGSPGGYVLFCWDNFFASFMHSVESRYLAFNEAIQMCREVDDLGFVPNFSASFDLKSRDRSQPPVGSMMVREIYLRYPEKWFLEETFDRLLTWNRWWDKNRNLEGYLCWGSDPFEPLYDDPREMVQGEHQAAAYESGLDNSPMYEDVPFDTSGNVIPLGDVGLMSLYVGDCEALEFMARELGRSKEEEELSQRAERYREKIRGMWDEEFGLFLNRRIDLDTNSRRISPTNFYALISGAPTQEQAERMVREHLFNPEEFWGEYVLPSIARNDPSYTGRDYWRGSIWAPMNFLVYLGLRNYDLPRARQALAEKSRELLLEEWHRNAWVRENYDARHGGYPGHRSDHMYHWGALLGMIDLMENNGRR
ncbi:MAG: trehalase family glycosidase [Bacteroidales bacterium]